ncbi:MAG: Gfo/Idh/MocA family oxidoreductase [Akkermansiaceae bacterium]|jgi:predicted dehydrogenase|nr:Gfo/Idh/MocA family oxidoreductase [Akkermansiaceae bacterium]
MAETLRWGILGSANIARKNWDAIRNSGNGVVVAVASRDAAKAQRFIDECQGEVPFAEAPRAIGGYDVMIAADDLDAIYIPLPTGMRKEWVVKAANAGKHVMCEKPCAINSDDLEAMTSACAANNVQFMDGVMYMHSDRMPKLREALDDPENVGEIRRIASAFSFCAPPEFFGENIRGSSELEPAGALGDLGWYTIRATLFVMNYEMPVSLRATLLSSAGGGDTLDGVPTELSAELIFANGTSATFYNSFLTENQQWLHVSGSKGHLRVDDFVLPYPGGKLGFKVANPRFVQEGCQFFKERNEREFTVPEEANNHPTAQETKLFRKFAELALSGNPDPFWPEISLKTQKVLDACLVSARNDGKRIDV